MTVLELTKTEGVTSLALSVLQLSYRRDIYNIWFQQTQLIAFCDSFNHKMCLIIFLISIWVFITLHYDLVTLPFKH